MRRDDVDDDYLDDDDLEDLEEPRSFFERGWVRAVLVLGALAVVLVVSLPYLLRWIDLSPPPATRQAAERPTPSPAAPAAEAPVTAAAPIAPAPAPATPPVAALPEKAESAAPPAGPASAPPAAASGGTQAAMRASDPAAAPARGKGDYWVQVGAFGDAKNAERLAARLRDARMPVEVTRVDRGTTPHVVRSGAYPTRTEAEAALKELRATGVTGFVAQGAPR